MKDKDLIIQLNSYKKMIKEAQPKLRKIVTNKNEPLKERFKIWAEHCIKKDEPWLIHKTQYGIIGEMVDSCWPGDYNKYRVYTWEDFLHYIEYIDEYDELPSTINKLSIDEFKEMLIETNFGSFTMDW
jgi:hypothetical protein